MRTRRLSCALVLASFVLAPSAQAATIMFSDTFGPLAVPFASQPLASLSQFDPSLGTLTQVTLQLDAETFSGTIAFDNEASVPSDVTLGIGAQVTATGLAGAFAVAVPLQTGSGSVDADNDGAADFVGTDAFSVTGGTGADSDSDVLTSGFAAYIGTGTFDVDVEAQVETFLSTTGGFGPIAPQPGDTQGTVKVIYEYTPVPEPGTASLLGLGLLSLVAARRRSR